MHEMNISRSGNDVGQIANRVFSKNDLHVWRTTSFADHNKQWSPERAVLS